MSSSKYDYSKLKVKKTSSNKNNYITEEDIKRLANHKYHQKHLPFYLFLYKYKLDMSSDSSKDDSSSSKKSKNTTTADCIRNVANFSKISSYHLLDKNGFNSDLLKSELKEASPKINAIIDNIRKLDEKDMKKYGHKFKHMIFSDIKNSSYGVKILASSLLSEGFNSIFNIHGRGFSLYDNKKLLDTKSNNFAILISKNIYDRPMNIKFRKNILELFNSRPDNINGDLIRFIILDQGFKEGIDLFDVKYVHLFEPLLFNADEKQAIGRSTRFCGQKGLTFNPRHGWTLYVFRYEISIPNSLSQKYNNTKQLFELYLKYSHIDLKKVNFAAELEKASIEASIDYELTDSIRQFKVDIPPPILGDIDIVDGGSSSKKSIIQTPQKIMKLNEMRDFIKRYYLKFKYPKVKLENKCVGGNTKDNIVSFTPSQDLIRNYFQSSSAYKGILLYHSVGTGKTCTAIATATNSFEKEGYTILWVTRHTLKNDIWKNMFNQICHIGIQERLKNDTLKLPKKITGPMRYLSKNWIQPISYKQFSNMLLKKNKVYDEMVKRNGKDDPLRKTLIIIDEAHKIYAPSTPESEKPNTKILEDMINSSYIKSKNDSVRIILMTATPYTEDGMEMIKLLNLLKETNNKFPINFNQFSKDYLDDNGYFTSNGIIKYQDNISGYISYLNRSQDSRYFAYPILENIQVPLTLKRNKDIKKKDIFTNDINKLKEELKNKKNSKNLSNIKKCKNDIKDYTLKLIDYANKDNKIKKKDCNKFSKNKKKECISKLSDELKQLKLSYKEKEKIDLKDCDSIKKDKKDINEKIKELKETKKIHTTSLKNIKLNIKELKIKLKNKKNELKINKQKIIDYKKNNKKIDIDVINKFKHTISVLQFNIKYLSMDISKLENEKRLKLISLGKYASVDFSQEKSLDRCLKIK